VQAGQDVDGEATDDEPGFAVATSEDRKRVATGAWSDDDCAGHIRICEWNEPLWVQAGQDSDGEAAGDKSGHAVATLADGSRVVIGAWNNDDHAGHVRICEWSKPPWVQAGQDIDGEAAGDASGCAVATSAD
jgi:hypothetical protein